MQRDARVKILALLSFLVILTTTPTAAGFRWLGYLILLCGRSVLAGLPLAISLLRAALCLPLSGTFAAVSLLSGSAERAIGIPDEELPFRRWQCCWW